MFENNNVVVWQKGKNRITISKKNRLYRAEQKILFFFGLIGFIHLIELLEVPRVQIKMTSLNSF